MEKIKILLIGSYILTIVTTLILASMVDNLRMKVKKLEDKLFR